MGRLQEFDPGRRDFLSKKIPGGVLAAWGLARQASQILPVVLGEAFMASACQPKPEAELGPEFPPIKERKNSPEEGDIVVIDRKPYLLRNGVRYIIPPTYMRNTKFEEYGRRVFTSGGEEFRHHSLVDPSATSTILESLLSLHPNVGERKHIREMLTKKLRNGGEMLLFFPGFITDEGVPFDPILPRVDTFTTFIKGLAPRGWQFWDALFFNYGEELWLDKYKIQNTTRDPKENIKHAKEFVGVLKAEVPLIQFNVIAHSLGCLFALAAAMEHPNIVNNLILINGPVRGLKKTPGRIAEVELLRTALKVKGIRDEKVTDYLFDLWNNKAYQKWVSDAVSFLRAIGKRVIVVIDESDGIVPQEAALIEEAELLRIRTGEKKGLVGDTIGTLKAHGRPLKYGQAIDYVGERIGEDLADKT